MVPVKENEPDGEPDQGHGGDLSQQATLEDQPAGNYHCHEQKSQELSVLETREGDDADADQDGEQGNQFNHDGYREYA